jgi:deoxyadenosine/deoxycytidine kinase
MYILEGNIGSGKSTFLKKIAAEHSLLKTALEPVNIWADEDDGKSLLQNFYTDTKRWALTFETFAMQNRIQDHLIYQQSEQTLLVERSIYSGHYCFAKNSHQSGFISKLEWKIYLDIFNTLVSNTCRVPQGFIYLRVDPTISYERARKRNRSAESSIPYEYIEHIHERHDDFLIKKLDISQELKNVPVIVIDCNDDFETNRAVFEKMSASILQFIEHT